MMCAFADAMRVWGMRYPYSAGTWQGNGSCSRDTSPAYIQTGPANWIARLYKHGVPLTRAINLQCGVIAINKIQKPSVVSPRQILDSCCDITIDNRSNHCPLNCLVTERVIYRNDCLVMFPLFGKQCNLLLISFVLR